MEQRLTTPLDNVDKMATLACAHQTMRIIKNSHLQELAAQHPTCVSAAKKWEDTITAQPDITNFVQLRQRFPHADQVVVKSKNIATIFNLAGKYRLITAIHYNRQITFILRLLTHAEYSKDNWKNEL